MREYRLRIAAAGASDVDGNVALELTPARAPVATGQIVHPTTGRSEMRPFRVEALDTSGQLTAEFTSAGRWTAIGRLCDVGFRDAALDNPGFEDGVLTPWFVTAGGAGGTWSVAQTLPRSGSWSATYSTSGQTAEAGLGQNLDLDVTPGQKFAFAIWARAATASPLRTAFARLTWLDSGGSSMGSTDGVVLQLTTLYQLLVVEGIAPPGTATVRFVIRVPNTGGTNTLHFDDASEWLTYGTGRISLIDEGEGPGRYNIEVSDESFVARRSEIFTVADTVRIWPSGIKAAWRGFEGAEAAEADNVRTIGNPDVRQVFIRHIGRGRRVTDSLRQFLDEHIIENPDTISGATSSTDNFPGLRLNYAGTDYPIVSFSLGASDGLDYFNSLESKTATEGTDDGYIRFNVWIVASSLPAHPQPVFLHIVDTPPSQDLPLHVGIADPTNQWGTADGWIHPVDLTRRVWDEIGVRYDEASLTALEGDTSLPLLAPRITERVTDAESWLQEHVWSPLMLAALRDAKGRRKLIDMRLPADLDPGTLPLLDASNTAGTTWDLLGRETVNSIGWSYLHHFEPSSERRARRKGEPPPDAFVGDVEIDGLFVEERTTAPVTGDTIGAIGRRNLELKLLGALEPTGGIRSLRASISGGALFDGVKQSVSRELLDIFQDGAYRFRGEVGRSIAETLEEGHLVLLDLDSLKLPNPVSGARSDLRLVRTMSITRHPAHAEVEFLDLGPNAQPLAAPTVDIAWSAGTPGQVTVTLSAIPAGATAELQVAYTNSASEPSRWPIRRSGLANGVYVFRGVPPDAFFAHARARSTAPHRIRSIWATDVVPLSDRPAILTGAIVLDDAGNPTVHIEHSAATFGVRYRTSIHPPGDEPSFGGATDVSVSAFPLLLAGVDVPSGSALAVELEPWTAFVGGSVTGTAGEIVVLHTDRGAVSLSLSMAIDVDLDTPGEADLTVRVADPRPGNNISIAYTADGPGVTPSSPQTLVGSNVTSDLDTTGSVVFTADLGDVSTVRFTASAPGRNKVSQTVTFGIEGPPGTPGVAGRIRFFGTGGVNNTDCTIEVQHQSGESGELFVWVNPSSVDTPDPINDPADGSVVFGSTPFVANAATSFSLTGGGFGTLLNDIPVTAQQPKQIFARAEFDDGTVAEGAYVLPGIMQIVDPDGVLAGNVVGSTNIEDDAIQTPHLSANSVTAPNIAAKNVFLTHMLVGSFENLALNPDAESGSLAPWNEVGSSGGTWLVEENNARSGTWAFRYDASGQSSNAILRSTAGTANSIAAHSGERYYFEAWGRTGGTNTRNARVGIYFRDAAGGLISVTTGNTVQLDGTYARMTHEATCPAGATNVQFLLEVLTTGGSATAIFFDDAYARRMVNGSIVVDGEITANKLNVLQLDAIAADVGELTAGLIRNPSGTSLITLDGGHSFANATAFIQMDASGTERFIGVRQTAGGTDYTFFVRANGDVFVAGEFDGDISIGNLTYKEQMTSVTGNQHDFSLNAGVSMITFDGASSVFLTGVTGGVDTRYLIIRNDSTSASHTIAEENASSSAANRFDHRGAGNIFLASRGGMAMYIYANGRWRLMVDAAF